MLKQCRNNYIYLKTDDTENIENCKAAYEFFNEYKSPLEEISKFKIFLIKLILSKDEFNKLINVYF